MTDQEIGILAIVFALALVMLFIMYVLSSLYRKVGPNRALIVYGRGGTHVVVGGGTVVMPLFQQVEEFNLELMSFDVAPSFSLYTHQGIPVKVEAITQLKVENEYEKIKRAANQFLSRSEPDREMMVRQVMEGHLRGIVGQLTVEQLVKDPELVSARMRETVAADLDKLGLEVVSFTLKDVTDETGYIQNMSRPEIARNRQMAEIAEAEAERNVAICAAETSREAAQARARADQDRVLAQALSQAAQAEAERDLAVKQAGFAASVAEEKAHADHAYEIQENIARQRLVEESTKVELLQKQQDLRIQQAEGERRAAELLATVQRDAEAEGERMRLLAAAESECLVIMAEGRARAALAAAQASAEGTRAMGQADAESIRVKGLAEAETLQCRVEALNRQNQAALLDKALTGLPELAGRLFEAYGRIGSVTYVASGQGDGVTSRIAQDVVGMVPLLGAVLESATGLKLREALAGGLQAASPDAPASLRVATIEPDAAAVDGSALPTLESALAVAAGNGHLPGL